MKHRPSKLPHKSGGRRPAWAMTPVWSTANFSLWGFHGLARKVEQRLNRAQRAASREAKLPLRTRMLKGLGRALRFRPSFTRQVSQKGVAR